MKGVITYYGGKQMAIVIGSRCKYSLFKGVLKWV